MIIRFELPDRSTFNAPMPAPIRERERIHFQDEQYGASEVHWQIRGEDDDFHGYSLEEGEWDQYVVLVKYHVRSVKGDYNSPLVPELKKWFL